MRSGNHLKRIHIPAWWACGPLCLDHSETGIRKSVVVVFILASEQCDDLNLLKYISFKVLG